MDVLVSINCITYNHENYIADAIESFIMQKTNFDFEIQIGEDCSTDNTRTIVQKYASMHPGKIKLITSEKNVGARQNSMRLRSNAKGKYIAICEGDDFWTDPYKLQKQVDYMESNPECSMCFHAAEIVEESGTPTKEFVRPYQQTCKSPIEDIISGGGGFCATPSILYKKKFMEDPPEFYKNAHVGDYPMQMIVASQGYAYYIDEVMAAYRAGGHSSWTSKLNSGVNVVDKKIKVKQGDIKLLNEFNHYTYNKYESVIENTIMLREFEILLLENRINDIKKSKYKVFYDNLSIKEKTKINSKFFFPKIYSTIVELKSYGKLKIKR
ncbi:glycosyltransferase [Peribacillus glennii]|nr:glycosyltransferase [Peribacillus glennii]